MNQIISKLGAMMLIGVLMTSVGTTQVFADWDKTVYPAIQGTIPIIDGEDYTTKNQISLVEAMTIAESILPNSKALYGKLTTVNDYLVYKIFMVNNDREHNKILVDAGSGDELYVSEVITKDYYKKKHSKDKSYNKKMNDYFCKQNLQTLILRPLTIVKRESEFDVRCSVKGGGLTGQAGAIILGIARTIIKFEPELKQILKKAKLTTRDSRTVERKKYGRRKARRSFQFSKR